MPFDGIVVLEAVMDPSNDDEEAWCAEQRDNVVAYLAAQPLAHGPVGEVPAWFVSPYVSIWAIESVKSPGWVGWWAISGDLPTDYCSADNCRHPRLAMRRIAEEWMAAIEGTRPGDLTIGKLGKSLEQLPLIESRAALLLEWSDDDDIWAE
ncbi:MAG TPA: DUF4826 family protein [Caulobacteraceae bacterium]|jgi:hypothetical protein|nr:DUF4826 family protein [Caulobacteraceae bacterium]